MSNYCPKEYWEKRLIKHFDLTGVGHIGYSQKYNNWLYRAKRRTLQKLSVKHAISFQDKAICDIGCGTGFFIDFYHHHNPKTLVGLDITDVSITKLNHKYPQHCFICADITAMSHDNHVKDSFDIVSVFDVLYHVTDNKLFEHAITNISRLVNEKGYLLLTDRNSCRNSHFEGHVKHRNAETYRTIFKEHKLEILEILPCYHLLNREPPKWIKNHKIRKKLFSLNEFLAPLYYFLDNFSSCTAGSSMNLYLAQKVSE
jgi:2-polyprenyl-3-methyl-5-hydroxy-6-metoxy-1,4-benzoquinol methylase